jgi:hypothetical protein
MKVLRIRQQNFTYGNSSIQLLSASSYCPGRPAGRFFKPLGQLLSDSTTKKSKIRRK